MKCSICEKAKSEYYVDGWTMCGPCYQGLKEYPDFDPRSYKNSRQRKIDKAKKTK